MSGVHESISTPLDTLPGKITVPIPQRETVLRLPNIDSPRNLRRRDQTSNVSPISKSWSETQMVSPLNRHSSFSSASFGRRPERSQVANAKQAIQEKKLIVLEEEPQQHAQQYVSTLQHFWFTECTSRTRLLDPELRSQLACHILAYADMLFSWQLLNKRLELLNTVKTSSFIKTPPQNLDMRFGIRYSVLVDSWPMLTLTQTFNPRVDSAVMANCLTKPLVPCVAATRRIRAVQCADFR